MRRQFAARPASNSFIGNIVSGISDLVDRFTNSVFALNHEAATVRQSLVSAVFFAIWILLSYFYASRTDISHLTNAIGSSLKAGNSTAMLVAVVQLVFSVFFNPVIVRHLLAFYLPYWLMEKIAAIYLADIFEKDEKVALTFIQQAAFGGIYHTIHVRSGMIAKSDEESPIMQIGGPGYIAVDLDSAVVVESPGGVTRVIGPTHKERHGKALIQGFERIRQCVDLRDVYDKVEISARSREGIPVSAKDVQFRYSIYRGPNPVKSADDPYPFDRDAVLSLVYSAVRPVKLDEAPVRKHDWREPLPGRIIGQIIAEMSSFINKRGLSDFLVGLGRPEDEIFEERRKETTERIRAITGQMDENAESSGDKIADQGKPPVGPDADDASAPMEFVPRDILTKMFYDNFQTRAPQRGTQLNWIGLGTWVFPSSQVILNKHREAWILSRENFARSNPAEMQHIYEFAWRQEYIRLIEEVPIRKLHTELQNEVPEKQINGVLKEYLLILERSRELYRRENIPGEISTAIDEIERWVFPGHRNLYPDTGDKK